MTYPGEISDLGNPRRSGNPAKAKSAGGMSAKDSELVVQKEDIYRTMFEQSLDSILVMNTGGGVLHFNEAAHTNLGYTREEFSKLHVSDIDDAETKKVAKAHIAKVMKTGYDFFKTKHRTKTGEVRDVYVRVSSMSIGPEKILVCVFHDITEEKRAVDALQESENKWRGLFENMRDGWVSTDIDGVFQECNPAYQDMLGYTRDELQSLTYQQLTPQKWHDLEKRIVAEEITAKGNSELYEKEYIHKDGTVFSVELMVLLVRDEDGKPVGMWGLVRDITERKKAMAVLEQKNAALQEILEQIQAKKDETAKQIAANMDVMLTPILNDLKHELSPQQQKYVSLLEKNLEQITSSFTSKLSQKAHNLTPMEIRICHLIRGGVPTKEIAELQHISPATVKKHRENIRNKLELQGENINLVSYLDRFLSTDS